MGLNERIRKIEKVIDEQNQKKEKKFRLPFGKKVGKAQKKKNYITIMKINENGVVNFRKTQISNQTFMEEGIPRMGTADYMLQWKKNPLVILPSWSLKPFSPKEEFEKSLSDGSNTKGYKILLDRMYSEQTKQKKEMGSLIKWLLGLGFIAIIGYAFLTG